MSDGNTNLTVTGTTTMSRLTIFPAPGRVVPAR